ncbi:MAG: DUF1549 domain-containing protein, partial [Planctomycetota bacterium]
MWSRSSSRTITAEGNAMPRRRVEVPLALLLLGAAVAARPTPRASAASTPTTGALAGSDAAVVATIDETLRSVWREAGVSPSRPAPDEKWARRLYLDLVGRTPTYGELADFASRPPSERRGWLIDRLLGPESADERSRWAATHWANLLIGRTGGGRRSLADRESFKRYLAAAFAENRPYDKLAREMITATGSVRPEDDDHNPAASFLADKMAERGVQATAKTAQVFLGVSVQCTQCHDHPFNEWRQNQFWELNAFFRQTRLERLRPEGGGRPKARLIDRDFYGEGRGPARLASLAPGAPEQAESYYELRNGKLRVAYPVFIDGTSLADVFAGRGRAHGDSGRLSLVNRREELASLVVESEDFAAAAVNREWARLLGRGFTRPPEDRGPHNPPAHPSLLEALAEAFRNSGHDLTRLTRWIVSSEAYGLDSRAGRVNEDDNAREGPDGGPPLFSRFYVRQLTAEQVYDSLLSASRADEAVADDRRDQMRTAWLRRFTIALGNDENGEATSFNGSIPQALAVMNGQVTRRATDLRWSKPNSPDGESLSESDERRRPIGFLSEVAYDPRL